MKRRIGTLLCGIFTLSMLCGCNSGSSGGTDSMVSAQDGIKMTDLSAEELAKFGDAAGEIKGGYSCTKDGAEHAILDDFTKISFDISDIPAEERLSYVGECWNDQNEPFYFLPDPAELAEGRLTFETLHFSVLTWSLPTREQQLDQWAHRAAARKLAQDAADEEMKNVLRVLIDDVSAELGLDKKAYGGQMLRYVLGHDTKTELMRAFADGDAETLLKITVNSSAEYLAGKCLAGKCPELMTKSWGDNAANIYHSFDEGDVRTAANEIAKSVAGNLFPPFDYMDKYSKLIVAMADVWENDCIEEQYQVYARAAKEGRVSDDDWNLIKLALHGAEHRLNAKGINVDDLRAQFEKRFQSSEALEAEAANKHKEIARWMKNGLMDINRWGWTHEPLSITQRLNMIEHVREMLREMLTKNGEVQKGTYGKDMTTEVFLDMLAMQWLDFGVDRRAEFYQFLRENGLAPKNPVGSGAEYVWVCIKTTVEKDDNIDTENEKSTYTASALEHSVTHWEKNEDWAAEEQSSGFRSSVSEVPQTVKAGDTLTLTLRCEITDENAEDLAAYKCSDTASLDCSIIKYNAGGHGGCKMEIFGEDGRAPERIPEAEVAVKFPEEAELDETVTMTFEGSGAVTTWTFQYKPLNEGKPHHWKLIYTDTKQEEDTHDELGSCVHTKGVTTHSYKIDATQEHLDPKTQHATFTSTCSDPPEALKAGEQHVFTLTCAMSDCNAKDWSWHDYVNIHVDVPYLDYGFSTGGWDLPASVEGEPDHCGWMAVLGVAGEQNIPSAKVVLEFPEGSVEYEQRSVYFYGSQCATEWVYQWEAIE